MQVFFRQGVYDSGDSKGQGHPRSFAIPSSLLCVFRTMPLEHQNGTGAFMLLMLYSIEHYRISALEPRIDE